MRTWFLGRRVAPAAPTAPVAAASPAAPRPAPTAHRPIRRGGRPSVATMLATLALLPARAPEPKSRS